VPAHRLSIGGDSAGGGLSLALLCRLREMGKPQSGGAVLISPWVDLSCSPESYARNARYDFAGRETVLSWARHYAGRTALSHPSISPIHAELHGLPPLFVVSGGIELLADEIASLVEKVRAAGVSTEHLLQPEMVHNFPMLHSIHAPAKAAIAKIADFVKARAKP
jgi:monoterpene epsilon-lactone hydrolase